MLKADFKEGYEGRHGAAARKQQARRAGSWELCSLPQIQPGLIQDIYIRICMLCQVVGSMSPGLLPRDGIDI